MACPDFQSLTLPILQIAGSGDELPLATLRPAVVKRLGLSEADVAERIPSGKQTRFYNRMSWACIYLAGSGLLDWVRRGTYRITARGRAVLANPPARIDIHFMSQYPDFKAWRSKSSDDDDETPAQPATTAGDDETATPEEQLEAGYTSLRRAIESELLAKILQPNSVTEQLGYPPARSENPWWFRRQLPIHLCREEGRRTGAGRVSRRCGDRGAR